MSQTSQRIWRTTRNATIHQHAHGRITIDGDSGVYLRSTAHAAPDRVIRYTDEHGDPQVGTVAYELLSSSTCHLRYLVLTDGTVVPRDRWKG